MNNKRINKGVSVNPIALVMARNFGRSVRYFNIHLHNIAEGGLDKLKPEERELAHSLVDAQIKLAEAFLALLAKK
jgi:hypothetical protein